MHRNIKALGLVMIAALSIAALAASAAQAAPQLTGFETGEGGTRIPVPTTISATTAPGQIEKFSSSAGTLDCHVSRHGTKIENSIYWTSETYIDPNTEGPSCTNTVEEKSLNADVNTNGCETIVTPTSKSALDEYKGVYSLACPVGKRFDVKVTKPGTEETRCTIEIPAQEGLGTVVFRNNTANKPMDLSIEFKIEGLKYITTGGLLNCGAADGEHAGGKYTGVETVQGFNEETGKAIDLEVSGE